MKTMIERGLSLLLIGGSLLFGVTGQRVDEKDVMSGLLNHRVAHFEMARGTIVDGMSILSKVHINLHLGIEEIPRRSFSDPPDVATFSLALENKSIREILDTLCAKDVRYKWSIDGDTINIYPRASAEDVAYFPNLRISQVNLQAIPYPEEALTPLSKLLPKEQIAYISLGGDNSYSSAWTVTFKDLTVRQLINRVTEHIGPKAVWVWQGSNQERLFTFVKGSFNSPSRAATR